MPFEISGNSVRSDELISGGTKSNRQSKPRNNQYSVAAYARLVSSRLIRHDRQRELSAGNVIAYFTGDVAIPCRPAMPINLNTFMIQSRWYLR